MKNHPHLLEENQRDLSSNLMSSRPLLPRKLGKVLTDQDITVTVIEIILTILPQEKLNISQKRDQRDQKNMISALILVNIIYSKKISFCLIFFMTF